MGPKTREHALEKLDRLMVKVGYPDKWIDYSSVEIGHSYMDNVWATQAFLWARELRQIGLPPDRTRWEMTPQTVNAYYNPSTNEIVFPAAILQYPFFDPQADAAFNYGAIGVVIGHELTHGYDDQGRQFDAYGNMVEWWTPQDAAEFKRRAAIIIDQFNAYKVFGHNVNGDLTQGENIADLGGGKLALFALRQAQARGVHTQVNDAFTSEQRFFLAWAQVWRNHIREDAAIRRLKKDPHAPGVWRVNGPMSDMPEFYEAFGVRPNDGMWRSAASRVDIW
jgi:putative endopeptidase